MRIEKNCNKFLFSAEGTLKEAMAQLDINGSQILIIIDKSKKVIGTLTDGDIRRFLLRNENLNTKIFKVMNKKFIYVLEKNINQIEKLFNRHSISSIPILSPQKKPIQIAFNQKRNHKKLYNKTPIVIMAGGKGNRLLPLTKIIPKPLIPVGRRTMIELIMEKFYHQGFKNFHVIVNYKKDLIKSYLNEADLPYEIKFINENKFLGTAGGLNLLKNKINESFILSNCDVLADLNYQNMIDWHNKNNSLLTVLGVRQSTKIPYGILKISKQQKLIKIDEKPSISYLMNGGIYVINPNLIKSIKKNSYTDFDTLIEKLILDGSNISCYPIESGWNDIGQFEEYKKLSSQIIEE